jgi:hypothetical protein
MNRDEKKEILSNIQNQISAFDNKASIFLAAIGIVFALAISLFDVFHYDWFIETTNTFQTTFKVLYCAFIVNSIILLSMYVLVLLPRKHNENKLYANYYKDVSLCERDKLNELFNEYSKNDDLLLDQIKINANICARKHRFLNAGIILFIPFIILLSMLILITVLI